MWYYIEFFEFCNLLLLQHYYIFSGEKAQFLRAYEAAAEDLSQPDNMDDPPDFSALPPTNVLDNHLKEYEKLIRASEEAYVLINYNQMNLLLCNFTSNPVCDFTSF